MLGTTIPTELKDGRVTVCSAGYSLELQRLVRIYPLSRRNIPRRWHIYSVPLERNPTDNRDASWKLAADRTVDNHDAINECFEEGGTLRKAERPTVLRNSLITSIHQANKDRLSLAIIQPKTTPELYFEHNPDSPDSPQLRLFDASDKPATSTGRFPYIPRVRFMDDAGRTNQLMVRDWGVFEFMRKHGHDRHHELRQALHLGPTSSLLIGNLNNVRNAWIVISVLNGLREPKAQTLFDLDQAAA
jgi:hypothetical protein